MVCTLKVPDVVLRFPCVSVNFRGLCALCSAIAGGRDQTPNQKNVVPSEAGSDAALWIGRPSRLWTSLSSPESGPGRVEQYVMPCGCDHRAFPGTACRPNRREMDELT